VRLHQQVVLAHLQALQEVPWQERGVVADLSLIPRAPLLRVAVEVVEELAQMLQQTQAAAAVVATGKRPLLD
jgi:hypothetical protein